MTHHLLCLTVDTDPDGLNSSSPDRRSMSWAGLENLRELPDILEGSRERLGQQLPITWFVRIDRQLESELGSIFYLLERYGDFWAQLQAIGHELGWHPHLYRQNSLAELPVVITDPSEAVDELEFLWEAILKTPLRFRAFRNGEGWHFPETFAVIERFEFSFDSTAIPGRIGKSGHPLNWLGSPNQPFYPSRKDIRRQGQERQLLELPMNTWLVRAPYDKEPRLRYMAPSIHESVYAHALQEWNRNCDTDLAVWVMICHPDELWPGMGPDALYARSIEALIRNLEALVACLSRDGDTYEFTTVSDAGDRWRDRLEPHE